MGFNGIISNPWWVLIVEVLHGLTFAWVKSSIVIFADRLTHNNNDNNPNTIDLSTFSQGVLSAVFSGIGQGLGVVIGGLIYDKYGDRP